MLLKHGLAGLTHTAAAGGTTRRRMYVTTPGGSGVAGSGLEFAAGTRSYTAFTFSGWIKIPTGHLASNTLFASSSGVLQIYTGVQDSGVMNARPDANVPATTASSAYPLDTWFHLHVRFGFDIESTKDCIVYINGTELADMTTDSMVSTTMDGEWVILQDDGPDNDFEGEMFDIGLFGSDVAVSNRNQSGTDWADFGVTPTVRLDGQNISNPGEDSSGNGNDFTQSTDGSSSVALSADALPPGANP